MIRVAFASDDRRSVNLHFGAAEQFVVYDVSPGFAELVGVGRFVKARMKGVNAERRTDDAVTDGEEKMTEDKVVAKIEFLRSCAGVYAAKIGSSSIKRLMQADIQPIIVTTGFAIEELLNEVSLALACGGLSWVDRAVSKGKTPSFTVPTRPIVVGPRETHSLITSIDDLT